MKRMAIIKASELLLGYSCLSLIAGVACGAEVVGGSLGNWLDHEATPHLVEVLDHHPRLEGAPIRITEMRDGHPVAFSNRLTADIREQLTHSLLSRSNATIVLDDPGRCRPVEVDNMLGIEVERAGRDHRVSLAIVDVAEGVWINGTNLLWNGRLSTPQRRAFESRDVGDIAAPGIYDLETPVTIADALYEQLQCHRQIPAPILLAPSPDPIGRKIMGRLRERLSTGTLLTVDPDDAESTLMLRMPAPDARELSLELSPRDGDTSVRIAEVTVSRAVERFAAATQARSLVSEIFVRDHPRDEKCEPGRASCIDVEFELFEPAWTVMFYTVGDEVAPVSCAMPDRLVGIRQYGLNVPPQASAERPALGFYVLAFEDRASARSVQRSLVATSSRCEGRGGARANEKWIATLADGLNGGADWQAIFFERDGARARRYGRR